MADRTCSIPSCPERHLARGYCITHYGRWKKHGDPLYINPKRAVSLSLAERFWMKVDVGHPLGCWQWTAGTFHAGHGKFNARGKMVKAHRWAYEHLIGPIPSGLALDHLCRNAGCVNPDHLEPVTLAENTRRGHGAAAKNGRKTHCKYGHALTPDNTYNQPGTNFRYCRMCARQRVSEWRKRTGYFVSPTTPSTRRKYGDEAGYSAIHGRLWRTRGRAAGQECTRCDRPARCWALNWERAPLERVRWHSLTYSTGATVQLAYCVDLECYEPLCDMCHASTDARMRSEWAPWIERNG